MNEKLTKTVLVMLLLVAGNALAETINGVDGLNFVSIGDITNTDDTTTGYGAVGYTYSIGQNEITIDQFMASGIADSNYGRWNDGADSTRMVGTDAPAVNITWHQAARFCNFLTSSNVLVGAYGIDETSGDVTGVMSRAAILASGQQYYVMPTEDEWYKAAYHSGGSAYSLYANGTGTIPVNGVDAMYGATSTVWAVGSGALEQNGTKNMMGNVWEWTESAYDGELDSVENVAFRGGSYFNAGSTLESTSRQSNSMTGDHKSIGMRIVAIPEPGTISVMGVGTIGLFITRTIRRRKQLGISLIPVRSRHLCDTFCSVDEWNEQLDRDYEEAGLSEGAGTLKQWAGSISLKVRKVYKGYDKTFWNFMVKSQERRVARRVALRTALKKKSIDGFDAFLKLILK